jgi:hypothetical protein
MGGMDCVNPTATFTVTMTVTPAVTNTGTPTFTPASQNTATYTPTASATYTETPATQAIKDLRPYPNPYTSGAEIYFGFTLDQKDCTGIGLRIYTAASRQIREVLYEGPAMTTIINNGRIRYTSDNFDKLATGTYFYYLYAVKNKVETRSKIDKIIIIR